MGARGMRSLTSIEMSVLGLFWLRGPCTTYAVMKELSSSGSSYYKSRAGTAYSITKRLTGFGLVGPANGTGEETERLLVVTAAGETAIRSWLTPPIPHRDIAHSADLVRLRFFFLGMLEPDERLKFIDDCLGSMEKLRVRTEALVAENEKIGDYFGALATLSIILETRARIEWLQTVRRWVESPPETGWTSLVLGSVGAGGPDPT